VFSTTPRSLYPRERPGTHCTGAVWAPGPVWTCTKYLALTGIRSLDRPARSQSLYRLSYRAHRRVVSPLKIKIPLKYLGRQRWAERFNSGVEGLIQLLGKCTILTLCPTQPSVRRRSVNTQSSVRRSEPSMSCFKL
jgi:hypothetical protein